MTTIHTNTNTDTVIDTDIEMVGIDMLDAAELAEICDYVADWIRGAPPVVGESLACFGASGDARMILLEALDHFGALLVRLVPSVSPTRVRSLTPLAPGEALGLAQLLVDLAVNGWPADGDEADCMAGDCRSWAVRLFNTPGMVE
jgi:hypothetical protein